MKIDRMKIGQLFNIEKGTLQSSKNTPGKYDFITASRDWKTHNEYTHDCEALIFAMGASGSLGRTHYANGKFIASDLCFVLTPKEEYKYSIDLRFYYHYFNSLREEIVKYTATGTSKLAINITNFSNYEIDYYPIEVQRNISRKIDLVIPKINLLEHQIKDTLADINQLKQSILQQAVQGQLVEQDPNDEPAAELLRRIREEKERLIKVKKIKKEKPLPPITPDEIPYELPKGWEWVRLDDVSTITMGQSPDGNSYNTEGRGVPLINGPVEFGEKPFSETLKTKFTTEPTKMCNKGDILICVRGSSTGRMNIAGFDACIGRGVAAIKPYIHAKYLQYFILLSQKDILNSGKGSTFPNISHDQLRSIILPLPPYNEQVRISTKIDELFNLCDILEHHLQISMNENEKLWKACLVSCFG